ncbi:hypothetical protein [Capybara microvirus Cap1_SP_119]|nr:hypothetical protein [Capybara microvirus Cap1_SP_119]
MKPVNYFNRDCITPKNEELICQSKDGKTFFAPFPSVVAQAKDYSLESLLAANIDPSKLVIKVKKEGVTDFDEETIVVRLNSIVENLDESNQPNES